MIVLVDIVAVVVVVVKVEVEAEVVTEIDVTDLDSIVGGGNGGVIEWLILGGAVGKDGCNSSGINSWYLSIFCSYLVVFSSAVFVKNKITSPSSEISSSPTWLINWK